MEDSGSQPKRIPEDLVMVGRREGWGEGGVTSVRVIGQIKMKRWGLPAVELGDAFDKG